MIILIVILINQQTVAVHARSPSTVPLLAPPPKNFDQHLLPDPKSPELLKDPISTSFRSSAISLFTNQSLTSNLPRKLENSPTCFHTQPILSLRASSLSWRTGLLCVALAPRISTLRSNASQHAGSTVLSSACNLLPTSILLMRFRTRRSAPCLSVKLPRTAKPVIRNGS